MPTARANPLLPLAHLVAAGGAVTAQAGRGRLEVRPVAPGIVRVRVARGQRLPAYRSLALVEREWSDQPHQAKAVPGGMRLEADGIAVSFDRESGQISFDRGEAGQPFMAQVTHAARGALGARKGPGVAAGLAARAALAPEERVYGLGEKTGWLDKRFRRYQMRTTDVLLVNPEIGFATDPLYASFPVFLVHSLAGTYGVFVDNPETTTFDFTLSEQGPASRAAAYEFSAAARALTYYVLAGPSLPDVVRQYTELTGRAPLPALWTLGYHQCRWSYRTVAEFRAIARELRERHFPADALWFDIDYMDGFRVFTWHPRRFARPRQLIAELAQQGFRAVTIVDPGVKVDRSYGLYKEGRAGGHFLRHPDGREYNGAVWPGRSAFPDFHAPAARAWWGRHVQAWLAESGVAGIWNDMNEPGTTDLTGPLAEVRHAGGKLPHAEARNTYGLEMARATYAAMRERAPDSRPFILTRAAFSGAQRYAALWGGDNSPVWGHLAGSLPMLLNLGLSGMPLVGVDMGGFAGSTHGELLARWFQAGAFYPFCRNHAMIGTNPHEPWAFGLEVEAICRRALELRYRLLPYTYSLAYEASQTGAPLMRPLVWHFPNDPATFDVSDAFLYGPSLLVAPVVTPGQRARAVYLPRGRWYTWAGDEPLDGPATIVAPAPLDTLPLFVRGGALLPMWPVAQHTEAIDRAGLALHVWPGSGALDFYEDDGATQAYTRGGYRLTPFRQRATRQALTLRWGPGQGGYRGPRDCWHFVFHAWPSGPAELDGRAIKLGAELRVPDDGRRHTLTLAVR